MVYISRSESRSAAAAITAIPVTRILRLLAMILWMCQQSQANPVTSLQGRIHVVFLCDVSCQNTIGADVDGFFKDAEVHTNEIYTGLSIHGVQVSFKFVVERYSSEVNLDYYACKDGAASCHPLKREDTFLSEKACPFAGTAFESFCGGQTGSRLDEFCQNCGSFFVVTEEEQLHLMGLGGAAYTGSMCKRERFGLIAPVTEAIQLGAKVAHELGHQFGMPDEIFNGQAYQAVEGSNLPQPIQNSCQPDAGCPTNTCVMNGVLEKISNGEFPSQMSDCSKAAFQLWTEAGDTTCVE